MQSSKVEHFPKGGSDEEAEGTESLVLWLRQGNGSNVCGVPLMTEVKSSCSGPTQSSVPVEKEALRNTQVLEEAQEQRQSVRSLTGPKRPVGFPTFSKIQSCQECDLGRLSLGPSPCTEMPKRHDFFIHADL